MPGLTMITGAFAFARGNWQAIAIVGVLVSSFAAGWWVQTIRWENDIQQREIARAESIEKMRKQLRDEYEAQRQEDEAAQVDLRDDLEVLRDRNRYLSDELESVRLSKSEPEVVVKWRERIIREEADDDEICAPALANPFGHEFVRLFNESAARGRGLPGADPEDEAGRGDAPGPGNAVAAPGGIRGSPGRGRTAAIASADH